MDVIEFGKGFTTNKSGGVVEVDGVDEGVADCVGRFADESDGCDV
jgi:hypothetical protein